MKKVNWIVSLALIPLLIVGILWWMRSGPAVVQYENLKYIQLLRTACSSQRMDQLEGVQRAVEQRKESGNMTKSEWDEFAEILDLARDGNWQQADQAAMRLEQSQLNRHRPAIK